ncbi:MAG TPA: DapH/DapD/GlmU-related protein [Polyangia bacterium]|jgi:serine O-acetyltransferase
MLNELREDLARVWVEDCYGHPAKRVLQMTLHQGAAALCVYRFGRAVRDLEVPVVGGLARFGYFLAHKAVQALTGINIHAEADLGPGTYFHGFGDIHIVGKTGRGCTFIQGGQLISASDGKDRGWPTLGDNVYVGAGAKVVGPITIGSNVVIGANAVVTRSLPDNVTVASMPARIVKQEDPAGPGA